MKVPASLTESGFVPPELNVKEKGSSPLAYEPVPKGLVKVTMLPSAEHSEEVETAPETLVKVQVLERARIMLLGKFITIFESVGILWLGFTVTVYVVVEPTVGSAAVTTKLAIVPLVKLVLYIVIPDVLYAIL